MSEEIAMKTKEEMLAEAGLKRDYRDALNDKGVCWLCGGMLYFDSNVCRGHSYMHIMIDEMKPKLKWRTKASELRKQAEGE